MVSFPPKADISERLLNLAAKAARGDASSAHNFVDRTCT